jgi:chromosome partitioning protein
LTRTDGAGHVDGARGLPAHGTRVKNLLRAIDPAAYDARMIVTVCGQKGGAGKTTIATNVIPELITRGRRVLLVDVDGQGTARTWADKAASAGQLAPAIAVVDGIPVGPGDLYNAPAVARWLRAELPELAAAFDDAVIDCPGTLAGGVQAAALSTADIALVPAGEDAFSAWSLARTADLVRVAQAERPELLAFGVVAAVDKRRRIAEQARQHIGNAGLEALATEILDRAEYVEAAGFLQGATTYKPRSEAAAEIRALVDELLRHHKRRSRHGQTTAEGSARRTTRAGNVRRGRALAAEGYAR